METIFTINDVNLHYDQNQVLHSIHLTIYKNKITAFIGPSGCGKSTLLRCFNRMNDLIDNCCINGNIEFATKNLNAMNPIELRTKVGMVFQTPNPFPMSIFENVAYGPKCQGVRNKAELNKIVIDSLKKASLYEEVKERLHESALGLSGGQQQRLCIARCIAMSPEVILMDEPTSALDPIATLKIEELITTLKKDFSIIIVTHNMQQAARISDYTAFFLMGEIVEYGKTTDIFKNPQNKKTEDYITGRFG